MLKMISLGFLKILQMVISRQNRTPRSQERFSPSAWTHSSVHSSFALAASPFSRHTVVGSLVSALIGSWSFIGLFLIIFSFTLALAMPQASAKSGSLHGKTQASVQKIITDHQKEFYSCYQNSLKSRPQLQGRVTLQFELDSQGKILRSEIIRTSLQDPKTELCIIDQLKRLKFPGAPTGLTLVVEHVFRFSPR